MGIIVNDSRANDSGGWDFIVELPKEEQVLPAGLENDFSNTLVKIQVKSIEAIGKKAIQIKLSNMKRFTHEPNPAFFFYFVYDQSSNFPIEAHIIYVDENLIMRTLKRLRECDDKNVINIHKQTMSISYESGIKLESISGDCLYREIKKSIGDNVFETARNKFRLLKTLGYDENGRTSISFTTNSLEEMEQLVDTMLGLRTSFTPNEVIVKENRFGIEKEVSRDRFAKLQIDTKSSKEVYVLILDDNDLEISRLKTDVFSLGGLYQNLPEHLHKMRLASLLSDFIINLPLKTFQYNFNIDKLNFEIDIFQLQEELAFLFDLSKNGVIALEYQNQIGFKNDFGKNTLHFDNQINNLRASTNHAVSILNEYRIRTCCIKPIDLLNNRMLIYLFSFSIGAAKEMMFEVPIIQGSVIFTKPIASVFTFCIKLGEWHFAISMAITGETFEIKKNGGISVFFQSAFIVEKFVHKQKAEILPAKLKALESTIRKKYSDCYDLIFQDNKYLLSE